MKRPKPKSWKSLITGEEYDYSKYTNHGNGGIVRGLQDLPNEYPFTIVYQCEPQIQLENDITK